LLPTGGHHGKSPRKKPRGGRIPANLWDEKFAKIKKKKTAPGPKGKRGTWKKRPSQALSDTGWGNAKKNLNQKGVLALKKPDEEKSRKSLDENLEGVAQEVLKVGPS